jgi:pimeloyl-ACP methyl ester carboxylesterase
VHTIQRRGRPGSGPLGDQYGIATECDDVAAVRAATGARYVFGHSYSGLIALEAARRDPGIAKLALYEPGVSVQGLISMDWIPRYRQFLAEGRPMDAFATFTIGMGPAAARRNPRWLMSVILRLVFRGEHRAKIFQLLDANLREHEEVGRLNDSYLNYREVSADVLLMAGGKSGLAWVAPAFDRLTRVLPSARVHTFPKLNHFGPDQKGPAEVADVVTPFLLSDTRIPEEILNQWEISDADRADLAGLPKAVQPFFHLDPQSQTRPTMRGGYYRIANDLGREIGVGRGGVVAADPLGEMPDCFVNSSIADLVEFLRETGSFQTGVAGMDEDEAAARVREIRERLRRRDPAAFAGDTWWSLVFEQLESGQL